MLILTPNEIRTVENRCFERYSTEAELMLRAGTACFNEIVKKYDVGGKSFAVLCGNGKNAGDGFVIARLLYCAGADVKIVICDKMPQIAEPIMYFEQAKKSGVPFEVFDKSNLNVDYIVDTMFGIGFHGEPRAPFDFIFECVSKSNATVISVDTPSGTNAENGAVCKNCVRADFTIAISTLKYCHVLPPANEYCGDTTVVDSDCYDIGYAETISLGKPGDCEKITLPRRNKNSNKGTFGHQLNICGSYKMFGAAVICASAAIKSGVGLVKAVLPTSAYPLAAAHLVQPIFSPLAQTEHGTLSADSVSDILPDFDWADSIALGCGLGVNEDTVKITDFVLKNAKCPVILDADGINCVKSRISIFKEIKAPVVLTPHPAEMARLVSKTVAEVQADRIGVAKAFAAQNNVIVVLKGANTVVTDGERVFVNLTGNPAMAMGGTGDMLTGIIASLTAQGVSPFEAAAAGVYIHGLCGDRAATKISMRGITVDDMTEQLGTLMSEFE